MEAQWREHTLSVRGDWPARWLFLAPSYELWLDDTLLDKVGGPRMHARLEAIYEDEDGARHLISAEVLSIIGFRPSCELTVGGELLKKERVRVENFINPLLIIFIIGAICSMFIVGPKVLRQYMPGAGAIVISNAGG
jgi:hypothetical protein